MSNQSLLGLFGQRSFIGLVVIGFRWSALVVMKQKLAVAISLQARIKHLNIFENRRICRTCILEEDGPFDRRKVVVLHSDKARFQPGLWIPIDLRVLGALRIKVAGGPLRSPTFQQLG